VTWPQASWNSRDRRCRGGAILPSWGEGPGTRIGPWKRRGDSSAPFGTRLRANRPQRHSEHTGCGSGYHRRDCGGGRLAVASAREAANSRSLRQEVFPRVDGREAWSASPRRAGPLPGFESHAPSAGDPCGSILTSGLQGLAPHPPHPCGASASPSPGRPAASRASSQLGADRNVRLRRWRSHPGMEPR